jgi:hypothetical protein
MSKIKIEKYTFGSMTINGKKFTSDLIIHAGGRIEGNWRRDQGHLLAAKDIDTIMAKKPDKLIVGTGASGRMHVSESVTELCEKKGIEIKALPTSEAAEKYNKEAGEKLSVAACFHLTC